MNILIVIAPCDADRIFISLINQNSPFKILKVEIILKYFPDLTEEQRKQFAALYDLYIDWNAKINVISRKDIENLYEHHVLHSLGIAKVIQFRPGTKCHGSGYRRRISRHSAGHSVSRKPNFIW